MAGPGFDLENRTARFGEAVVRLCLKLSRNPVLQPLLTQCVSAATSIGANYAEADEAESKADFRHKIAICRKESKESLYWCRLLAQAYPAEQSAIQALRGEARELHLIFCRILRSTDSNLRMERRDRSNR